MYSIKVNGNSNIGNNLSGLRIKSYTKDQEEAKLPWPATFFVNMLRKDNKKYNNTIIIIPKSYAHHQNHHSFHL